MMASKLSLLSTVDTVWAIDPSRAEGYVEALGKIDATAAAEYAGVAGRDYSKNVAKLAEEGDGVLYLTLSGPSTKIFTSATWFIGGYSTIETRRILRAAARHDAVKAVFLYIDSPGGQAAGTEELAADVASLAESKPVLAFISDMCCSAAYWVASQATAIIAEPGSSAIGNIGCYGVIYDASRYYTNAGVDTHLFTTGPLKGAGAPGTSITDDQKAHFQEGVEFYHDRFTKNVAAGRNLEIDVVRKLADGRAFTADQAKKAGLIDDIAREDRAYEMLLALTESGESRAQAASAATNKTMSTNAKPDWLSRLLGRPAAAQDDGAGATADQSVKAEIDALRAELAVSDELAANLLTSRLKADAESYADSLVSAGKIVPAMRERIAELYAKSVLADNPSGLAVGADGSIKTGDSVAALKSAFESAPTLNLTKEQVASAAPEGAVVIPTDKKPDTRAEADRLLAMTPLGKKALAARSNN